MTIVNTNQCLSGSCIYVAPMNAWDMIHRFLLQQTALLFPWHITLISLSVSKQMEVKMEIWMYFGHNPLSHLRVLRVPHKLNLQQWGWAVCFLLEGSLAHGKQPPFHSQHLLLRVISSLWSFKMVVLRLQDFI
jgi:hypothetical protein